MAKKGAEKVPATRRGAAGQARAARHDPTNHERLDRQARRRGLSIAADHKWSILERLEEEDRGSEQRPGLHQ